jgi:hypothetical protein
MAQQSMATQALAFSNAGFRDTGVLCFVDSVITEWPVHSDFVTTPRRRFR